MTEKESKSATSKSPAKRRTGKATREAAAPERPPESAENFEHVLRRLVHARERRSAERRS